MSNHGEEIRTRDFSRNRELEALLGEVNDILWTAEQSLLPKAASEFPLLFIVGCPWRIPIYAATWV